MTLWNMDGIKTHLMYSLPTMNISIESCSHQTSLKIEKNVIQKLRIKKEESIQECLYVQLNLR